MVLFFPLEQDLDCISRSGQILGKIKFDVSADEYRFYHNDESVVLTSEEQASINERLLALVSGQYVMPMQDDD